MKVGVLPALIFNDLAIALKNKTLYLVLFIPFFVFASLKLVDQNDETPRQVRIALIQDTTYPTGFIQSIENAGEDLAVRWVLSEEVGKGLLMEKRADGMFSENIHDSGGMELQVMQLDSVRTLAVVKTVSALQMEAEGKGMSWVTHIKPQTATRGLRDTLPTWILMLVLLVGFIVLPAQVAEEKEKKLLLALLQSPMRESQWLIAKVCTGIFLVVLSVGVLHLLGGFGKVHFFGYAVLIAAGGFCFSACGILLGFLCRTQASARTLGLIFYLPSLLPCALSDVSQKLTSVAVFLPSYHFYQALKSILLENGRAVNMSMVWCGLILTGLLACGLSGVLMKRRWLMG